MNPYRSNGTLGAKAKKHKCKWKQKEAPIEIKQEADIKEEPSDGSYLIQDTPSSPRIASNATIKSESESDSEIDLENKPSYLKKEIKSEDELKKECDSTKDGNGMTNNDRIGESSSSSKPNSSGDQHKKRQAKRKKAKGTKNDSMAKKPKKPSAKDRKKHKCNFCNYVASQKGHLREHIRTHTGEKPFACEICAKAFTQKQHLNKHKKTTQHLHNLKQHMRTHSGERPFRCRICTKTFTFKSNLTAHSRTHTKELPFNCAQCGRRFADENEKQSHEDYCKSRRYDCYLCSFKCFYKNYLKLHMQVHHTGEKLFKCEVCGKKIIQKGDLKRHLATHSKQKPVHCSKCLKPFAKENDKNTHEKRCKRRVFQCYLCKVLKHHSTQLKLHKRNYHTGERPFLCKHCGARFSQLVQANVHMKKVHGFKK